jgi:hypothetical protein
MMFNRCASTVFTLMPSSDAILQPQRLRDAVASVGGFAHHRPTGIGLDHRAHAMPQQGVTVNYQNAQDFAGQYGLRTAQRQKKISEEMLVWRKAIT